MRPGSVILAAVLLAIGNASVSLAATFRCDEVYKNVSSPDNGPEDCLANVTHLLTVIQDSDHMPHTVLACLSLLAFVIGVLCCPTVSVGRYVCKCFGSYRRRPETFCCGGAEWDNASAAEKEVMYPRTSVRNTKAASVVVLALGFITLILCLVGTTLLNESYTRVFVESRGVLSWADTQSLNIRTVLTINETGELIPPLTTGFFDNITKEVNNLREQIDTVKTNGDPYMDSITIGALCLNALPLLTLLVTVIAAVCDCRRGILCCNIGIHFILLIPFSIAGFFLLACALVLGSVCGERELFLEDHTKPGLISAGLVPVCKDQLPFETTKYDVRTLITEQAKEACVKMQSICDSTNVYSSTTAPAKVYNCQQLTNPAVDCPSFLAAESVGNSMTLKPSTEVYCRTDPNDPSTAIAPCNISMCAQYCNVALARTTAGEIVTNLHYAANGEIAYDVYVEPLLDCNVIYAQVLRPLVVCRTLTTSLQLLGGSFMGYSWLFLFGFLVMWRGQKRFFKPEKLEESDHSDLEMEEKEFDDIGEQSMAGKSFSTSNEPKA